MTPEERADRLINRMSETVGERKLRADLRAEVAAAIREAVAEERDAIAAITDHWARVHAGVIGEMLARLSEVIRART